MGMLSHSSALSSLLYSRHWSNIGDWASPAYVKGKSISDSLIGGMVVVNLLCRVCGWYMCCLSHFVSYG